MALVALLVPGPGSSAGAQAGGSGDASQSGEPALGAVLADNRLSPALAGFVVDSSGYRNAYDAWSGALRVS